VASQHQFEIRVSGKAGVELDMLLVWKPTPAGVPERKVQRIEIPYSTSVAGAGAFAWFDTLPGNGSGQIGDEYTVEFLIDGHVRAESEGRLKKDGKSSSGVGEL
jgi:hypothetical protein